MEQRVDVARFIEDLTVSNHGSVSSRATRRGLWLTAPDPSSGPHDFERDADTFDEARAAEGGGDDLVMTAARTE